MHGSRSRGLLSLGVALALAGSAWGWLPPPAAGLPIITRMPISAGTYDRQEPKISGDLVVWKQRPSTGGLWSIVVRNWRTGVQRTIRTTADSSAWAREEYCVAGGRLVLFIDDGPVTGLGDMSQLYLYDWNTNATVRVVNRWPAVTQCGMWADAAGNGLIAWQDYGDTTVTSPKVYRATLSNGTIVPSSELLLASPAVRSWGFDGMTFGVNPLTSSLELVYSRTNGTRERLYVINNVAAATPAAESLVSSDAGDWDYHRPSYGAVEAVVNAEKTTVPTGEDVSTYWPYGPEVYDAMAAGNRVGASASRFRSIWTQQGGVTNVIQVRESLALRVLDVDTGVQQGWIDGKRIVYFKDVDATHRDIWMAHLGVEPVRLAGPTRYTTAIAVAAAGYPGWAGAHDVVIASGEDRSAADPLAAAGLCWAYDAPLLLTTRASLPGEVATALQQIKTANPALKVHIVGGPVAVTDGVKAQIAAIVGGANVERLLSTGNRYDMAAAIAQRMHDLRGAEMSTTRVLIANGADPRRYYDALALSALARGRGFPILLVGQNSVPAATTGAIAMLAPSQIYIGGGPVAVSEGVRVALGVTPQRRWWGANRYETASVIAEQTLKLLYGGTGMVAFTSRIPDALTAGTLVGHNAGVVILTDATSIPGATDAYLHARGVDICEARVIGGTASVSEATRGGIRNHLNP